MAGGGLTAFPVDDGDLLLLAGSQRHAVEQIAHGVAVRDPLLLEAQDVPVRDRAGLMECRVVVPVHRVAGAERPAPRAARERGAEIALQVTVPRELRGAVDSLQGRRAGSPRERLECRRVVEAADRRRHVRGGLRLLSRRDVEHRRARPASHGGIRDVLGDRLADAGSSTSSSAVAESMSTSSAMAAPFGRRRTEPKSLPAASRRRGDDQLVRHCRRRPKSGPDARHERRSDSGRQATR